MIFQRSLSFFVAVGFKMESYQIDFNVGIDSTDEFFGSIINHPMKIPMH